jgi:purine catabolism regulator
MSYERWKESIFHYIQDEIHLAATIVKQKVMTTDQRNEIILFLESTLMTKYDKVHNFLELLN